MVVAEDIAALANAAEAVARRELVEDPRHGPIDVVALGRHVLLNNLLFNFLDGWGLCPLLGDQLRAERGGGLS